MADCVMMMMMMMMMKCMCVSGATEVEMCELSWVACTCTRVNVFVYEWRSEGASMQVIVFPCTNQHCLVLKCNCRSVHQRSVEHCVCWTCVTCTSNTTSRLAATSSCKTNNHHFCRWLHPAKAEPTRNTTDCYHRTTLQSSYMQPQNAPTPPTKTRVHTGTCKNHDARLSQLAGQKNARSLARGSILE